MYQNMGKTQKLQTLLKETKDEDFKNMEILEIFRNNVSKYIEKFIMLMNWKATFL